MEHKSDWRDVAKYELEQGIKRPLPGDVAREVFVKRGELFVKARNPANLLRKLTTETRMTTGKSNEDAS